MSDLTSSAADQNSPERDEATAAYSPEIIENIYQKATGPSDNNPGGVPEQDETAAPAGGDDDKPSAAGKGGDEDKPRKIGRGEALLTSDAVKALDEADERLTREQGEVVRGGVKDIERMMAKMNSRPLPPKLTCSPRRTQRSSPSSAAGSKKRTSPRTCTNGS